MNIYSVLQDAASRYGDKPAVVQADGTYSYADMRDAAERIAHTLRQIGITSGYKVGLLCPNGAEYISAFYGILAADATVVPVSMELKSAEVVGLCDDMALDAYVHTAHMAPPQGYALEAIDTPIYGGTKKVHVAPARERRTTDEERARLSAIGAANIRFTSGTTSKSKGVILSHASILKRASATGENFGFTGDDSILWMLSMAHHFVATITPLIMQGAKVVVGEAMNPKALGEWVSRHGITRSFGAPLSYKMLINEEQIKAEDLAPIRNIISTATYLPGAISEKFRERFGREIVQAYGLIEVGIPFVNLSEDVAKRGSVGPLGRGYETRIEPLEVEGMAGETVGELLIRGEGLFDGYYEPWRPRDEVLEEGWFRTGDIVRIDADGYYWIVGRNKEIINVGGIKVFPTEIEKLLMSHPEVEEALVYPAEDPRFGEVPHAKVRLAAGAACTARDLLQYTAARMSVFKAPRAIEVVAELPKTSTGKLKRFI